MLPPPLDGRSTCAWAGGKPSLGRQQGWGWEGQDWWSKEILARGYPRAPRAPLLVTSSEEAGNSSWGTERDGPTKKGPDLWARKDQRQGLIRILAPNPSCSIFVPSETYLSCSLDTILIRIWGIWPPPSYSPHSPGHQCCLLYRGFHSCTLVPSSLIGLLVSLKVTVVPGAGGPHVVQPLGPKPGTQYCSRTSGCSTGDAGGSWGPLLRQSCRVKRTEVLYSYVHT